MQYPVSGCVGLFNPMQTSSQHGAKGKRERKKKERGEGGRREGEEGEREKEREEKQASDPDPERNLPRHPVGTFRKPTLYNLVSFAARSVPPWSLYRLVTRSLKGTLSCVPATRRHP